eukprot:Phypoly_transcript_09275.p1 GENE.Phypoly_transcript_09275~~Phypoly_transcript_09275.p1  ORF type:complete len:400 (+),score=44.15 Phypoly_transcript_09275:209-1408(+)
MYTLQKIYLYSLPCFNKSSVICRRLPYYFSCIKNPTHVRSFSHFTPLSLEKNILFQEAGSQFTTIGDLIRFAMSRFTEAELVYGQGTQNVYEDATFLVYGSLSMLSLYYQINKEDSPITEATFFNSKVTISESAKVLQAIKDRIEKRMPSAYILKQCIFNDFQFYVDERAIIPRSLIGEVIMNGAVARWLQMSPEHVTKILDMCTGSGFLAILLANYFPNAEITAVDISPNALSVAEINIKKHGMQDHIKLVKSNLFQNIDPAVKFDIIVSNPPYATPDSMDNLPIEFKYEPTNALGGGSDGLDFVREILNQTMQLKPNFEKDSNFSLDAFSLCRLSENGVVVVEAGEYQKQNIQSQFPNIKFSWLNTSVGGEDVFVVSPKSWFGTKITPKKSDDEEEY